MNAPAKTMPTWPQWPDTQLGPISDCAVAIGGSEQAPIAPGQGPMSCHRLAWGHGAAATVAECQPRPGPVSALRPSDQAARPWPWPMAGRCATALRSAGY